MYQKTKKYIHFKILQDINDSDKNDIINLSNQRTSAFIIHEKIIKSVRKKLTILSHDFFYSKRWFPILVSNLRCSICIKFKSYSNDV